MGPGLSCVHQASAPGMPCADGQPGCAGDSEQGAEAHAVRVGELASLLYWLMIVGYHLRTLEVRWDIEQSLMLPC